MPEHIARPNFGRIESYRRIGEDIVFGSVAIEEGRCTGCGLCVGACAARVLELRDKKARMVEVMPACMSCGDCVAICPTEAIALEGFLQLKGYFRYLDRGEPKPPRRF